ncbi:MAG TPA: fluoride efflux transporter CrcB [Thermomicrobiales bacterium]|nr:fluoride efflux transporter CrcB [Thermomicrobiales bacterium]
MALLLVAVGGVLGANARYVVSQWAATRWGAAFPYGTLAINATGSLLLGLVLALDAARFGNDPDVKLLVATGFLGAYTTFSTFAFETLALGRQRDHWPAVANIAGSVALGLGGAALGVLLGGAGR